jgi:peroxiredoxin
MLFPRYLLIALLLVITACDDLYPSADDKRQPVDTNAVGYSVGQIAPDFSLLDTENNMVQMLTELNGKSGIVLYFTMWCPICNSHMYDMETQVMPNFPNVRFLIVDFVSGTVSLSRDAQLSNGYANLTVLVDNVQEVLNLYNATMGTTIVIENSGSQGTVRMNEDYKDGTKLIDTLTTLP